MVKLDFKTDVTLDIYPKNKLAVLKIQEQEISNYVFDHYIHYPDTYTVRFFGAEGTETATVKYDCMREW